MTITEGHYRGVKVNWTLANETDGQMWTTLQPINLFMKAHLKEIPEEEIRKCFSLPKKDEGSFALHVLPDNEKEINWCYMWSGVKGVSTQYEYLAYLFRGIDALWKYIHEKIPFPQPQIKYQVAVDFKFKDLLTKIQNEVFSKVNASKWPYEWMTADIQDAVSEVCGKDMLRYVNVEYSRQEDGTTAYTIQLLDKPIEDSMPPKVPVAPKAPAMETPAPEAVPPAVEK